VVTSDATILCSVLSFNDRSVPDQSQNAEEILRSSRRFARAVSGWKFPHNASGKRLSHALATLVEQRSTPQRLHPAWECASDFFDTERGARPLTLPPSI